jgi:hypothetical protein
MNTPLQELLEWVRATLPMDLDTPRMIEEKIESMLEKEKEVIKNAYIEGCGDNILCESTDKKRAEEYYNETFNTEEKWVETQQ